MDTCSDWNSVDSEDDLRPAKERTEIITFRLAGQEFGIATACVDEVIPARKITRVPGLDVCLDGIIYVRGAMVPVVALKNALRVESAGILAARVLVILRNAEMGAAFVAESIPELQWVRLEEQNASAPPGSRQYVSEMVQTGERWVMVLDGEKLVGLANTCRGAHE